MMGTRLGSSLVAASAGLLLTSSAQAAPTTSDQTFPDLKMRLAVPRFLAQGTGQAGAGQPAVGQTTPTPSYPPQTPGAYSQPSPGGYPPAPGYAPYPYPAPTYPMPYYYPPAAPEPEMRPTYMEYEPNKPIPPGYRLASGIRKGLVIPGSIMFGISYVISIIPGAVTQESYEYDSSSNGVPFKPSLLFIPVLGPWIALGTVHDYTPCSSSSYSSFYCSDTDAKTDVAMWRVMLIIDGFSQTAGALLVTLGIAMPWKKLVLTDSVRVQLMPVPMGHGGQGLAMLGTFGGL